MITDSATGGVVAVPATRRRSRSCFVALAWMLVLHVSACGSTAPPPVAVQRLLEGAVPVTLARETRLGSDLREVVLLRQQYEAVEALPTVLTLPASLAEEKALVVQYHVWMGPPRRRREVQQVEVLPVEKKGAGAAGEPQSVVAMQGLRALVDAAPVKLRVTVFPLQSERVWRATVDVPEAAKLRFGYGLREESWSSDGVAARFEVSVDEPSGVSTAIFSRVVDPRTDRDRRWFEETADLAMAAGRRVTLRFAVTPASDVANGVFMPVWGDPVVYSQGPTTAPNIMIVSFDTLRARSLGCYGYRRDTSPFIDEIARQGVLFERAFTTSATTGPSHMSLFTGLYPPNHGIMRGVERKLPEVPTLAQTLREHGYRTAAFTENGFIIRDRGFGQGFAEYTENPGETMSRVPGEVKKTFSQARGWLESNDQAPFFLFVHTYQVHSPYSPPTEYRGRFDGDAVDEGAGQVPVRYRNARDNYDREIRFTDDAFRDLFEAVRAAGFGESTIVVLLADHGEEFGEHGGYQHGAAVFDEVLRVPLIFWAPGRMPAGRRYTGGVSLIDVAPTVLTLAGIETPESMDGTSLMPVLVDGTSVAPRTLFAEARASRRWKAPMLAEPFNPPVIGILTEDKKLIVHRPSTGEAMPPVAYDLRRDPQEKNPSEISGEDLQRANEILDDYLAGNRVGDQKVVETGPAETLSPEVKEKLRLLGYIE